MVQTDSSGPPRSADERYRGATEQLAYSYWQERGCPFGTPEIDWFRAEDALREHESNALDDRLVAAARIVGSTLGEVAAALTGLRSAI